VIYNIYYHKFEDLKKAVFGVISFLQSLQQHLHSFRTDFRRWEINLALYEAHSVNFLFDYISEKKENGVAKNTIA
jgi:hypothetical protein